jgi:hypothetical protein
LIQDPQDRAEALYYKLPLALHRLIAGKLAAATA